MSRHYAVWIDHTEARVFHFTDDAWDESKVHAPIGHVRQHTKGPDGHKEHPAELQHYYHDVARALDAAEEVLVLGPGVAKLQFIQHAHKHDRALEPKIIGVETVDHPTDKQLVAYARKYFKTDVRVQ